MAKYKDVIDQIRSLKRQAEILRRQELREVVADLKKIIKIYALTPQDLGFGLAKGRIDTAASSTSGSPKVPPTIRKASGKKLARTKVAPKYRDQTGNTWTGRGLKPKWVVAALEAGHSLDSLQIRGIGEGAAGSSSAES